MMRNKIESEIIPVGNTITKKLITITIIILMYYWITKFTKMLQKSIRKFPMRFQFDKLSVIVLYFVLQHF